MLTDSFSAASIVDSLKSMELRNHVRKHMDVSVSIFELWSPVPLTALARKLALLSGFVRAELREDTD